MIEKLLFVAAVLTAVHGNAVAPASRQGSLNKYYLYRRDYFDGVVPIEMPDEVKPPATGQATLLDPRVNTVIIVHGHNGDSLTTLNPLIKNEFFRRESTEYENIIVVDWSSYTKQSFSYAAAAVPSVGHELGKYLAHLIDMDLIKEDNGIYQFHLIGFNLGAHVVGYAGRELKRLKGEAARITGLDPSRNSPSLTNTDARYVEVIHTDGDGLLANGIGNAIGHADFFVNGGSNQPGCLTRACSHNRAWEFFAATLVKDTHLGYLCNNHLQLSLNRCTRAPLKAGGDDLIKIPSPSNGVAIYRVNTGRTYPY